MPIVKSSFSPARWLRNPHLQTIFASRLFTPAPFTTTTERHELPDGDFIDLSQSHQTQGDIVALFHGLSGCVQSSYIQGVFASLTSRGFSPVLMHWRGCSGEPNRLARSYHSGASDDVRWFINHLHARHPHKQLYAVGYSLGANALLKYLGEDGDASPLSAAVAISPPLVLAEGAKQLNTGFARIYQRHLLTQMKQQHEEKRRHYPQLDLPPASADINTLLKFDDALTAPLHGYKDAHDYYTQCSARRYLSGIERRTHILSAADDPFFTANILPTEKELSSSTTLELSRYGGHVGFLQGRQRWLDQHIAQLISKFSHEAH